MLRDGWFLGFLFQDPEGRAACTVLLGALALCVASIWALAHFRALYGDELFDLAQDLQPQRTYRFSETGRLEAYPEGVRVLRGGTCVSPMLKGIWSTEPMGSPGDRVLRVKWLDGDEGPRTTDVRCGAVEDGAFYKLIEILEHYGKG